jgi:hypothetical protein
MEQYHWDNVVAATLPPVEAIKLIRKLRWIGLEEEARQLQLTTNALYARKGGILSEIPYETD